MASVVRCTGVHAALRRAHCIWLHRGYNAKGLMNIAEALLTGYSLITGPLGARLLR